MYVFIHVSSHLNHAVSWCLGWYQISCLVSQIVGCKTNLPGV